MRTSQRALRLAVVALLLAGAVLATRPATTVTIPAGGDTQAMLDSAPEGSVVRLAAGVHLGPLTVDERIHLEGEPGARVVAEIADDAAIHVTAGRTRISDLTVVGGWTGIELDDAAGTVVEDVRISGADLQGMLIYKASATIDGVSVSGLRDPHAQGIEVLSAPDVVVRNSRIEGGKIGIVGHLSDVVFDNNRVSGTTLAGVVIREMGMGFARGNTVTDAVGAGLYCGDMSRCAFENNRVEEVGVAGNARSEAGWGLVVHYRASASTDGDALAGVAGSAVALSHSRIIEGSAMELGAGAAGVWPGIVATLLSVIVLAALYQVTRLLWRREGSARRFAWAAAVGTTLLLVGVGVQSFHMLEHIVQLYRVRMDGLPSRGSLVGSVVDTEWVHFGYNALVVAGLGSLLFLRRRGWVPGGKNLTGDRLILAATLLQGYHVVEHSLKVFQHVTTGAKVNPGILGNQFDLVLFHFGLNAAIYLAFIAGAIAYLWGSRLTLLSRLPGRTKPQPI